TTYTVYIPDPCQGTVSYDFTITVDCPAPVTLTEFTATASAGNVILHWITSQEINNAYFKILSSTDGIHFTPVATVKGTGTTSSITNYTYTDRHIDGVVYYQLVQVDYNGTETAGAIISVVAACAPVFVVE